MESGGTRRQYGLRALELLGKQSLRISARSSVQRSCGAHASRGLFDVGNADAGGVFHLLLGLCLHSLQPTCMYQPPCLKTVALHVFLDIVDAGLSHVLTKM